MDEIAPGAVSRIKASAAELEPGLSRLTDEPPFRLGRLEVQPATLQLSGPSGARAIERRMMQVLLALHRRGGKVLSKPDLIDQCWGMAVVGDDAISQCIAKLRRALQATAGGEIGIETVPRVGYRLQVSQAGGAPQPAHFAKALGSRGVQFAAGGAFIVLIGLAAGLFVARPTSWKVEHYRVIDEAAGAFRDPALSPNGKQIVYVQGHDFVGPPDLYLRQLDDEHSVRLTNTPQSEFRAAWSPDGDRIAFARAANGQPCTLMVKALPAGGERVAGHCRVREEATLAWDRSGQALYFNDRATAAAPMRIFRLDLTTGAVTPLSHPGHRMQGDLNPRVSPDGRSLAFRRIMSPSRVDAFTIDLASGRETQVTRTGDIEDLDWASDGRSLMVIPNSDWDLWDYPVDGRGRPYSVLRESLPFYAVSTSGSAAVVLITERRWNLVRVHDGRSTPVLPGLGLDGGPEISRDGALAFSSIRDEQDIYVQRPGEQARRMMLSRLRPSRPRWSPDGRRLAFRSVDAETGIFRLFVVNTDGTGLQQLPLQANEMSPPDWSPDGRAVLAPIRNGGGWRVWSVPLAGPGRPRPLAFEGWRWIRVHRGVIYGTRDAPNASDGVWKLESEKPPVLVGRPPEGFAPGDWTITDGKLYVFAAWNTLNRVARGQDTGSERLARVWVNDLDGKPMGRFAEVSRAFGDKGLAVDPRTGDVLYTHYGPPNQQIGVMTLKRERRWSP